MTMNERNRLIEQYMSGQMDMMEEQQFHRLLQSDDRLLHMLEAEQLIRNAIARSGSSILTDHTRMRANALSLVASTPAIDMGAAPAADKTGLFSGATGIALITTCVILIMGAFIFRAAVTGPRHATRNSPAVMQPGPRQEPAPQMLPVSPAPSPAVHSDSIIDEPSMPRQQKRARALKQKRVVEQETMRGEHAPEIHEEKHSPVILRNDTLRARLNIEQLQQR